MTDTLWSLVEEAAARTDPERPAVSSAAAALAYGPLLAGARGVAGALRVAGVGRGDRVGLWMEKTPSCLTALLGALRAGAAYVPLDPRAPWRRCRTIARDAQLSAVVIDAARLPALGDVLAGDVPRLVLVDGLEGAPSPGLAGAQVLPLATAMAGDDAGVAGPRPDDPAYVLYTSGSTGAPKGVVHTHASGLAFVRWMISRFGLNEHDVFSAHAPLHFDLSISDIFGALGAGASVRLISALEGMLPPHLVRGIREWGITVWYSVPSILVQMLELGGLERADLPGLRALFFAGEVFPTPHLLRLRRALPRARLVNLFGPTETNVCTYHELPGALPDEPAAPIPIGAACEHLEVFVVGDDGEVPAREGTLWVRGANLMRGYWNDPARTAAALRPDPRGAPGLAYDTGDRVRVGADGALEFLGRRDDQVKIRGHRVELGEVEATLASHPGVLAVAAALVRTAAGEQLVAAVVPRQGAALDPTALRAYCRERVPAAMVPEVVALRDTLPRTSTGKLDRVALRSGWEQAEP